MHEIARWDLDRLYTCGDIIFPILELKTIYCDKGRRNPFKTYSIY